jgi:penicillin-binding protein 1C
MEKTKKRWFIWRRLRRIGIAAACLLVLSAGALAGLDYAYPFPLERLESWPASPRITDRAGRTMLERVAGDGQWRLPVALADISPHVIDATIATEDKRFYSHGGVDFRAALRASWQNVCGLRVVSGASTLSMQVCRMMDDRPRTLWSKAVESFRAWQLERLYTKDQILQTYLNLAPYGHNIRGIEAASLMYFGKHAKDLSLAEAAMLAGLPQSPNRYQPIRHADRAAQRCKVVLARMRQAGMITPRQREQALAEGAVAKLHPHQILAPHAAWLALSQRPNGGRTTIDLSIQAQLERLCAEQSAALPEDSDIAAIIVDIPTSCILAMVGSLDASKAFDGQVNGVTAWRSPGSALKPFLYAAAFETRRLGPDSTVYDVPIHRTGWSPANFDKVFNGPLPAAEALRRSLNVPAILVAEGVGLGRCCGVLESAGLRLPGDVESRGGLAIVTGGIEVRLLDLTAAYATLGRRGKYLPLRLLADQPIFPPRQVIEPDVCLALDDILSSRRRRPRGMEQLAGDHVPWFMWKTGTSSARRDAVAVGHNGRYAIGVWVGRFDGQGDGAFIGAEAAEPLLAQAFALHGLRMDVDPPPPPSWETRFPLAPPAELDCPVKITYPHEGAVFMALGDHAIVQPVVNRDEGLTWFLNGLLIEPRQAQRLILPRGRHELRCTDVGGNNSSVRFLIK